jgi:hypothetical protein
VKRASGDFSNRSEVLTMYFTKFQGWHLSLFLLWGMWFPLRFDRGRIADQWQLTYVQLLNNIIENLLNQSEFAELHGIKRQRVGQLIKSGELMTKKKAIGSM